jgi:ribosomal protein L32
VAVISAVVLLVVAGLATVILPLIPATIVLAFLAAAALLWLRATLHLGLAQESREITVSRSIICPNCGHMTPQHTFCGHCGISLRALPKARRPAPAAPAPTGTAGEPPPSPDGLAP